MSGTKQTTGIVRRCEMCRYYDAEHSECRRHAPQDDGGWPHAPRDRWCGEWYGDETEAWMTAAEKAQMTWIKVDKEDFISLCSALCMRESDTRKRRSVVTAAERLCGTMDEVPEE